MRIDANQGRRRFLAAIVPALSTFVICPGIVNGQDKSGFPDGYDAVQAAPDSHKVIFENALVRVLEVIVPSSGKTEPMHHHRWPGFFLDWDTGGMTPHVIYHRADGGAQDQPSMKKPIQPGKWSVQWMKPEPMHAIEVVDRPKRSDATPPLLRVELKYGA